MILQFEIYKNKIFITLLVLFLFLWAVMSTSFLLVKKQEVILLKIENGEIKPITTLAEERTSNLDKSFLMSFVSSYYHYDSESFDGNMKIAETFFSSSGWNSVTPIINQISDEIKKTHVVQAAVILHAGSRLNNEFKLKIKFYNVLSAKTLVKIKQITIRVHEVELNKLTREKPFPYEVDNVLEESI